MEKIELEVANRVTLGKKVRFLRRQGVTPVHLYGHDNRSEALQCPTGQLKQVLTQAGHTRIISLKLDSEKKPRNVVVREVQREALTGKLLHVDFYQVKMEEKVKIEVPIVLGGEAPALRMKDNVMGQELDAITVECLPAHIPPSIEVDVSSLAEVDQAIRVKDISVDKEVTVLNDPEAVVVKIGLLHIAKAEEEEVPAVAEIEEAEVEAAAEEETKEEPKEQ